MTKVLDQIIIEGLEVNCIIGLLPKERRQSQPLEIDFKLSLDLRKAARTKNIAHTLNYADVANKIVAHIKKGRFELLETAAESLCTLFLKRPVHSVEITLRKPRALKGKAVAGVKLVRHH
jgi:dihydroneopterin aldolase